MRHWLADEQDRQLLVYRVLDDAGAALASLEYQGAVMRGVAGGGGLAALTHGTISVGDTYAISDVGTMADRGRVSRPAIDSSGVVLACPVRTQVVAKALRRGGTGADDPPTECVASVGIDLIRIESNSPQFARFGRSLFVSGMCPSLYDGAAVYAGGFSSQPEHIHFQPSTGTSTPGIVYLASQVFTRYDAAGQLHRSAPSAVFLTHAVTDSGLVYATTDTSENGKSIYSTGNGGQEYSYPLPPSNGAPDPTPVCYRSTSTGTVQYRNGNAIGLPDTFGDAELEVSEPLYTTGGVLDNATWPPCDCVAYHQDRLWVHNTDSPGTLWFTKEREEDIAPEWNEGLAIRVSNDPIVALVSMDTFLVAFTSRDIYVVEGVPPNSRGTGGNLESHRAVPGIGCTAPRSVIRAPDGVYWQSQGGIYRMTGNYAVDKAGVFVDPYLDGGATITGAVLRRDWPEIMFAVSYSDMTSRQCTFVLYDRVMKQWATHSVYGGGTAPLKPQSCCEWDGKMVFTYTDAGGAQACAVETTDYLDPTYSGARKAIAQSWETPDLQFSRGGYQRVRDIVLDASSNGPHGLDLIYTYDDGMMESKTIAEAKISAMLDEQIVISSNRQKVRSLRVRVTEVPDAAGNAGPTFSSLVFWIRQERGPNRTRPGQRA